MSHVELALSSNQLPDKNGGNFSLSGWGRKLAGRPEQPLRPEDQYDQDILAVTEPYALYLQNIALQAAQAKRLPENMKLEQQGNKRTLRMRATQEYMHRHDKEYASFDHVLQWRQERAGIALLSYRYAADNLTKNHRICTLQTNFDATQHIQDLTLAWDVGQQGGPYELTPIEGLGGVVIGNEQIDAFMTKYLARLHSGLRDGETAQSSISYALRKQPSLSTQEKYRTPFGSAFGKSLGEGKLLGETLTIDSVFQYNERTKMFERRFGSEGAKRTYMTWRPDRIPLQQSITMSRQDYVNNLQGVLDILPFPPTDPGSTQIQKR